jgi:hypothetical protein
VSYVTTSTWWKVYRQRSTLRFLAERALSIVDDAGVETVLTLAFVAQLAVHALPLHGIDGVGVPALSDEGDMVETGTVVQMPATPGTARPSRAAGARESKGVTRPTASSKARVRRPDPVDDDIRSVEGDQVRSAEGAVRITIIGPDGEPRTKIVRLSGSRDGMAAPARRPHD